MTGLRRTEVASLAGVSIEYYIRMERGNLSGVSDSVLDGLARALQLDEAERGHLFDLARSATTTSATTKRTARPTVRPSIGRVLDGMTGVPAYVRNARMDILAALPSTLLGSCFSTSAPTGSSSTGRSSRTTS